MPENNQTALVRVKSQKLALLEEKKKLINGLPHLHGHKFYPWMRDYWEAKQKTQWICSGNQVGKSFTQIRKAVHWATEPSLWKTLWPHMSHPRLFFYFYPSSYLATTEFENKFVPDILPRHEFKNHPQYGWECEYRAKYIQLIRFNSGVTIAFKTYSQDAADLQASSPAAVFIDEEPPVDIMPEIQARLFSTNGFISASMTPTQGAEFFREVFEVKGPKERFPDGFKRQVSMYDCLLYEDGTPSHWTVERIKQIEKQCRSQAEVSLRVHGRFVVGEGLKYESFDPGKNVIDPFPIPKSWLVYVGVDSGSGGVRNHPSAISCIAMKPDYSYGVVFRGRRMDGQVTEASDVVEAAMDLISDVSSQVMGVYYDYSAYDLRTISGSMGHSWLRAEKSHEIGEQALGVAFKNKMLQIFNTDELQPLIQEFRSLKKSTPKTVASDDFVDSARYAAAKIPWDWNILNAPTPNKPPRVYTDLELREKFIYGTGSNEPQNLDEEFEAINELLAVEYNDFI